MTSLARYGLRAVRWQPLLAGFVGSAVLLAAARVAEGSWGGSALAFAALAMAAGLGFCLDDPASEVLAGVPASLMVRSLRAVGIAGAVAAVGWGSLAVFAWGPVPRWGLTVVAAGLGSLAVAIAAAARRRLGPCDGGMIAAPAVIGLGLAATTVPDPWALTPGHAGMGWRWAIIGIASTSAFLWNVRERGRRFA